MLYPLGAGAAPSVNTILVKAEVVDQVGGWEERFKAVFTDQAFLIKVYLLTAVYVSSECCDYYRQRANSSTGVLLARTSYHHHRERFLTWLEEYLREQGRAGTTEWLLLQRAMRPYRHPLLSRIERAGKRLGAKLARTLR
jgi:hypothetical protein